MADFSGSDALVIRDNVRTEQYDLKHLNGERKQSRPTKEIISGGEARLK